MMISKEMVKAMNTQIGHEFGASFQYLAIACYFESEGLTVLGGHFFRQADEERVHAMKFLRYVNETGGRVAIPEVPAPRNVFKSAEEAVELSLAWEKKVTDQINALMDLAVRQKDHLSHNFLEWFVNEQLEEVSSMDRLLSLVRRAGEKGLLLVEDRLAKEGPPEA